MANWFEQGGDDYARHRPDYPAELAAFLSSVAQAGRALDVGCGSGQLTRLLGAHRKAIGTDPSADQIAHATPHPNVDYRVGSAETIDLSAASVALITAAQAAHWFDRERFYAEVRRIAAPGAILALVSYGIPVCDAVIGPRFDRYYYDEIGPYWPPERKLVESGYAGIDFPFEELPFPAMDIHREWDLGGLVGYVGTWSAVRQAEKAGQTAIVPRFVEDLRALWGDPAIRRPIRWPITMRLGRV